VSSTSKAIKYAAPYRSATFNDAQSKLVGANGVITGGKVTTSGIIASVQPLTFIQNGLMTTTDYVMSATIPTGLVAPYSIAVTVTNSVEVLSQILVPTFVKRPLDVSSNTVIIADWDGNEWIARPKLQIEERVLSEQNRSVTQDQYGITKDFDVSYSVGNVTVGTGSLVDRQGALYTKGLATAFPVVAQDLDGFDRIDEIIYRRPDDDTNRPGTLKYVVGQSFSANSVFAMVGAGTFGNAALTNRLGKILVDSSNVNHIIYVEDYESRATLKIARTDEQNAGLSVTTPVVATNLSDFDAIYNAEEDEIDYVYVRADKLYYARTTKMGVNVHPETQIAYHAGLSLYNPKIVYITTGATYFLHIVYEVKASVTDHRLYYVRLSASNTIETAQLLMVSLSNIITNPSLAKDDGDSLLILAYENLSTGRIYLRYYDASTVTALALPSQVGTTLELQNNSYQESTNTPLPVSGASKPVVVRADNKDTFVFFKQSKGSAYGIVAYSARYEADFGYKGLVIDITSSSEDVSDFRVVVDGMNVAHVLAVMSGGGIYKGSQNLEEFTAIGSGSLVNAASPNTVALSLTNKGCLMHGWTTVTGGTVVNGGSPSGLEFFGPGTYGGNSVSSSEFVIIDFTGNLFSPGYTELPLVPAIGDTIVVAGGINAGTYTFTGSRSITVGLVNYTVVEVSSTFTTDGLGSTAQFYTNAGNLYNLVKSNSGIFSNLRSFDVLRTDIFLAHYRASDNVLAVSGTVPEESTPVARLYEYVNCFSGGGGVASWQVVGTEKLAFSGPFYVRFFNRMATYTIAAQPAGITISDGQIAYVVLPDEDVSSSLTISVVNFGAGILDRYGKNVYPLFWNISGDLYTRFAPFKVLGGETVVIGSTEIESKTVSLAADTTSKTVTLATPRTALSYSVTCSFVNLTDADPQFQPITVTSQTLTQFVAKWNAPTDSANYKLVYYVKGP
jgi:hypothetical protein